MSFYQVILNRIQEEQERKRGTINEITASNCMYNPLTLGGVPTITRFISTGKPYVSELYHSPTMFTPWGKVMLHERGEFSEQKFRNSATLVRALKSIPAQLIYDIAYTALYTAALIPNLVLGVGYLLKEDQKIAEDHFANAIMAPYFALSIIVDFLREFTALFTRTYATIMQTPEERQNPFWHMG